MKRGVVLIGIAAVTSGLSACGSTEVDLGSRPQFASGTAVLTVYAYDGLSGQGVENINMYMRVGPNTINAKRNGNTYTFTNVPAGSQFPIFASATTYLDFVGTTAAVLPSGNAYTLANPSFTTAQLVMYKAQNIESDLLVKVYDDNGNPVKSGQVVSTLSAVPANGFTVTLQNPLTGNYGFRPRSQAYPIGEDGALTIPRLDLVYGAEYKLSVLLAKDQDDNYLSTATAGASATIDPSKDYPQVNFFLAPPTLHPIVVKTSNPQPDDGVAVAADGKWSVTFATPVQRCVETGVHKFWAGNGVTDTTAADADDTTFALVDSELTLSVTPKSPTIVASPATASVAYNASVKVRVKSGGETPCVSVTTLCFQQNTYDAACAPTLNATVHIRR